MRALIVDDDQVALDLLQNILEEAGYEVDVAHNGREALDVLRSRGARLLVTDWEMPEMNGLDLCRAIRTEEFAGYVYVIMLTSKDSTQQKIDGLFAGADNFICKPVNPAEVLVCLKTAERILSLETRDLAMFALAKLAESRDPETGSHIERVQSYCRLLAQHLSASPKYRSVIDGDYVRLIYQTSPLHDIGKVGIPDPVLLKPGKLDAQEMAVMRTHTQLGAQTLDAALQRFPGARFLEMARDIAATHHEKFDGSGYPLGLAGEKIPLCGRIVAVADVYDALTSRRVYKSPMSHMQARTILVAESGRHFDPDVVEAFLQIEEHFLAIKERLADAEQDAHAPAAGAGAAAPGSAPAYASSGASGGSSSASSGRAASPAAAAAAAAGGAARDTILVVEDDPTQLEHLVSVLRGAGHAVVTAADGIEAKRALAEHAPRLVISDWVMPGLSGVELCRHIRSTPSVGYTQFLMLSMRTEKARMLEAFDAGIDDFVRKPFDESELLARIRAGLRVVQLHDELARKNQGSEQLNVQLSGLNQRLERLAITDDLTGLFNRRHAMARLEEQWAVSDRYGRPLTVALVDIDHFKQVNDTFGHPAGDAVLRQVAAVLKDCTRATDTVCRVGGEEFLVIYPAQAAEEAVLGVERARAAIESHPFACGGQPVRVTVSIGVTGRLPAMTELSELMREADQALYAAKQAGRNTVRMSAAAPGPRDEAPQTPRIARSA